MCEPEGSGPGLTAFWNHAGHLQDAPGVVLMSQVLS